jgi:hypothetical protein
VNDRAIEKLSEVKDLRTRADLLLAEAVKVKYKFRERRSKAKSVVDLIDRKSRG